MENKKEEPVWPPIDIYEDEQEPGRMTAEEAFLAGVPHEQFTDEEYDDVVPMSAWEEDDDFFAFVESNGYIQ